MNTTVPLALTADMIKERISVLKGQLIEYKPARLSMDDIEDVSDNYQAHLEYREFKEEAEMEIKDLEEALEALNKM